MAVRVGVSNEYSAIKAKACKVLRFIGRMTGTDGNNHSDYVVLIRVRAPGVDNIYVFGERRLVQGGIHGLDFEVVQLDQEVGQAAIRKVLGGNITGQWVDLGGGFGGLFGIESLDLAGLGLVDNLLDGLGVGKVFGQLHDQASDLGAARRAQVLCLIVLLQLDAGTAADHDFGVVVSLIVFGLLEVEFELSHALLQYSHTEFVRSQGPQRGRPGSHRVLRCALLARITGEVFWSVPVGSVSMRSACEPLATSHLQPVRRRSEGGKQQPVRIQEGDETFSLEGIIDFQGASCRISVPPTCFLLRGDAIASRLCAVQLSSIPFRLLQLYAD
ncbi:hypothetical protein KCU87_g49, partial [Aureobasidium melanogenum]